MNALHCEIINVLCARGKDEWTVEDVFAHINELRGDHSDPLTHRKVREALKALHDLNKVTRVRAPRNALGAYGKFKYSMAVPERIGPNLDDAWRTFKVSFFLWPYEVVAPVVIIMGFGVYSIINWIWGLL